MGVGEGSRRGWGRIGEELGRGWGGVGEGLDFYTSKTLFEKPCQRSLDSLLFFSIPPWHPLIKRESASVQCYVAPIGAFFCTSMSPINGH